MRNVENVISYPELIVDLDLILACVTHHFTQARRKLRSQRLPRNYYLAPSVHFIPAVINPRLKDSCRFAQAPVLR